MSDTKLEDTSSPSSAPTPYDWEIHRDGITSLYEDFTLKEVAQSMREQHNFNATPKMYKTRLAKWGVQKNLKAKQVKQLLVERKRAPSHAADLYLAGRRVDEKKIHEYLRRVSRERRHDIEIALADPSPSGHVFRDIAARAVRPQTPLAPFFPRLEESTCIVQQYVFGLPESDRAIGSDVLNISCLTVAGTTLLRMGYTWEAFFIIDLVMDRFRHVLWGQKPESIVYLAILFIQAFRAMPELAQRLVDHISYLCENRFRPDSQLFYMIMLKISQACNEGSFEEAWHILDFLYVSEQGHIKTNHAHAPTRSFAIYGLAADFPFLEDDAQRNLQNLLASLEATDPRFEQTLAVKFYLAALYYYHYNRSDDARHLVMEVLNTPRTKDCTIPSCYQMLFTIARSEGNHTEALKVGWAWIEYCRANCTGDTKSLLVNALVIFGRYLKTTGEHERGRELCDESCQTFSQLSWSYLIPGESEPKYSMASLPADCPS